MLATVPGTVVKVASQARRLARVTPLPGGSQPGNESGRLPTPQPTGYPCVRLSRPSAGGRVITVRFHPDITYDPTQAMHTVWREVHVGANSPTTSIVRADGGFVTLGIWTE